MNTVAQVVGYYVIWLVGAFVAVALLSEANVRLRRWWVARHRPKEFARISPRNTLDNDPPRVCSSLVMRSAYGRRGYTECVYIRTHTPEEAASILIQLCGGGPATVEAE